ncbi:uracil transporter [Escherichia coli]|uniref:Uracil transporter n=1 Tax=Escherichia coli TaxID=562 RepID=A0A377C7E6_ECOLX|nr:uracil transporter [Escherichia coli]
MVSSVLPVFVFDRIESGLQQSTEPDPDFRDFDHRRQWREGKHRRGGVERYGAGDHRRYRLKFDLQLISVLRPEEVVLDAEDADITDK